MASTCPTNCGRTRTAGQYLCRTCWLALPADARRELSRRGPGAVQRLQQLHDQIGAGTPLADIRIQ
jgi:hypothetical protein